MKEKPWIAAYWRYYRLLRKSNASRSLARRLAGWQAHEWWEYMKQYGDDSNGK